MHKCIVSVGTAVLFVAHNHGYFMYF